ncbi:glutathione S-transferase T3-like [Chenopodium quinoa]|uniref:glutathione S-transferase T3-like n=1 Tax=Chenopodium quinoa TaxID=63459 RepID=UPI000B76E270|nr:glutathione S-transferase T3-like [Chenopodium quinoa]
MSANQPQQLARASRIWSVAEDEALTGLYMKFSQDAISGTNQKATVLWRKVSAAYDKAQVEKPHILPPRPVRSLESHWRRMATVLLQWSTCYDEDGRATGSGYNEVDPISNASKLFYILVNPPHNFTCHHVWEMIKNDPKFRTKLRWGLSKEETQACGDDVEDDSSDSGKRCRTEVAGDGPSTGLSSGGLPRPDGVKKAKAKRNKGKQVASESAVLSIGEQMKASNENREREAILRQKKLDLDEKREMRKQKQVELQERILKLKKVMCIVVGYKK